MHKLAYSTSFLTLLRALTDEGGSGGGAASPTDQPAPMSLDLALASLDPDVDDNWTADGLPRMDVLEKLTGDTSLTRETVDGIDFTRDKARTYRAEATAKSAGTSDEAASPAGEPAPEPQPPVDNEHVAEGAEQFPEITRGRFVDLILADAFDGETEVSGLVVKVNDDGSCNVKAFAPNGGADRTFTGVKPTDYVDAMVDGADKNAARTATWSWPRRS